MNQNFIRLNRRTFVNIQLIRYFFSFLYRKCSRARCKITKGQNDVFGELKKFHKKIKVAKISLNFLKCYLYDKYCEKLLKMIKIN